MTTDGPAPALPKRRPNRTLGGEHDAFWEWCAKGELRLPECTACGHLVWPVAEACDACGAADFVWRRMGGGGALVAACAFHQDYYGGTLPLPYETMLVALDEGAMFVSDPLGFSALEASVGRRLRVAFVDAEDDAGAFRLPVFEAE